MPDIRHRVVIDSPPAPVYQALATPEGVSDWWTRGGVQGSTEVGGTLEFRFGSPDPAAVMTITDLEPPEHVGWRCIGGAEDWIGTTVDFTLASRDGGTAVLFAHDDWREASEFMSHCSARWAYFLLSLKQLIETGAGTPFPDDTRF
jgi:uncharacterized protein YndB with AHSA1/START domain